MNIITPKVEIWDQEEGLEGIYKHIERCGRVCYASDPIEGKAEDFVNRMINNSHTAMLEHGTVYLIISVYNEDLAHLYRDNPYSVVVTRGVGESTMYYITTNYRVIIQNGYLTHLKWFQCEPTEYHEKRLTVHFTTNIGVSREFNRHRVNSVAEQSTRYCNYGKDKFGGVDINLPSWVDSEIQRLEDITENVLPTFEQLKEEYFSVSDQGITKDDWGDIEWWLWSNLVAEESYLKLIEKGRKPQEARVVLPLDTNTELIHTAFMSDWEHFLDLRSRGITGPPHPDAKVIADSLGQKLARK